jgi:ribosomal protein L12E/L44/L45/RPP1/RPP2
MTSKLLRIVPMVLSLSIPALAGDPPAAAPAEGHESKDAKKKDKKEEKKDEKKEEKKAEEKK